MLDKTLFPISHTSIYMLTSSPGTICDLQGIHSPHCIFSNALGMRLEIQTAYTVRFRGIMFSLYHLLARSVSPRCNNEHFFNTSIHFVISMLAVAKSVILGYFTLFRSSSLCDHSSSFIILASLGLVG